MTTEKQEFIRMLGLDVKADSAAEERDKKTALSYVMSGASIPRTLMFRLENYKRRENNYIS
ncbi:MAG: hypothetical protein J6N76_06920 [Lachnospiraceae bacterium]|nr:hypothetical protein [Lachnospiraceae bacterium]